MSKSNHDLDSARLRSQAERLWAEKTNGRSSIESQADMMELIQELQIHQIELELQNEELQRTRDAVEDGLRRFTDLYDFAPIGYLTLGANGTVRQINLTGAKFMGKVRSEIINRRFQMFLPYEALAGFNRFMDEAFKKEKPTTFETQLTEADNGKRFIRLEGHANEEHSECRLAMMDITERKQAEDAVQRNLSTNMALARLYGPLVAPETTITTAAEIVLQEAKSLTGSQYGYVGTINEMGDLVVHTHISMMQDCDIPEKHKQIVFKQGKDQLYPALWGHALNTRMSHYTNTPHTHQSSLGIPQGHVKLTNLLSIPVILGDALVGQIALTNKPGGFTKQDLEDINRLANYFAQAVQRVQNKQNLTSSRDLMQNILTGIGAGIILVDQESLLIEKINDIALEMLLGTEDDYVGHSCNGIGFTDSEGEPVDFCPIENAKNRERELRVQRRDKTWLPVQRTLLEDTVEEQRKYLVILFDISQKKNLERRLAMAQKLESIGQLSAGVAHEINTPAQYIGQNLKFFQEALSDILTVLETCRKSPAQGTPGLAQEFEAQWEALDLDYLVNELPDALSQSIAGVDRITSIVKALKRFVHPGADTKQPIDINQALRTTSEISRNEWKYNAEMVLDLDEHLPDIPCVINDINQVFLNVVVNAAHALTEKYGSSGEKGVITLQTKLAGDWAEIRIKDTGVGIPKKNISRVFDPFFTTKEVGMGTGQGLGLAYSIVADRHGGTIDLESEEGAGTTCTIRLPVHSVK